MAGSIWSARGTISRGRYALAAIVLFALKFGADSAVSWFGFGVRWDLFSYISYGAHPFSGGVVDWSHLAALALVAVPFVWLGVALTLRRLRTVGISPWLVLLFFVPFVKFLMFALACALSGQEDAPVVRDEAEPVARRGSLSGVGVAICIAVTIGGGLGLLSIYGLSEYGTGLFLGIPFAIGLLSVVLSERGRTGGMGAAVSVSATAVTAACLLFLLLGLEGIICILMALVPALLLGIAGGIIGHVLVQPPAEPRRRKRAVSSVFVALPLLLAAEGMAPPRATVYRVATSIEIDAPPAAVWTHVVSFSEIPEPVDWLFRTGIAYPVRARIDGAGPGAIRYCEFTTGSFVEPIEVWDEPRLLRFSVRAQPPPMNEWSPWGDIVTPHLHGFFRSTKGQFELEPLPGSRTRLTGTTWYQQDLGPAFYWTPWADWIIHRIHHRVLRHIASEAR